ncbi:MAG: response regulator [Firmicutes bacterium]|nr:response regulator [Bacillota bacterium]
MQKTIFVIDDNDTNLSTAEAALENHYRVITLPSAQRMFTMLEKLKPNLILLDIEMPDMDGFEALRRLKENQTFSKIPVIFLTSRNDAKTEARGFELGAVDYISKPFSAPVLLNRVKTHIDIENLIYERTTKLERLQNGLIFILADLVESRDAATGGHIERTSKYLKILIEGILADGLYSDQVKGWDPEYLALSARLHDVGKITVADAVLNKLGSLTHEEFELIKAHAQAGEQIINKIIERTGDVPFLQNAKLFAGYHHERWDGKGYPNGLSGEAIPLAARILSLVDVYDALVSERVYKAAMPHEKAVSIICEGSGTQFDEKVVEAFMLVLDKFNEYATTHK